MNSKERERSINELQELAVDTILKDYERQHKAAKFWNLSEWMLFQFGRTSQNEESAKRTPSVEVGTHRNRAQLYLEGDFLTIEPEEDNPDKHPLQLLRSVSLRMQVRDLNLDGESRIIDILNLERSFEDMGLADAIDADSEEFTLGKIQRAFRLLSMMNDEYTGQGIGDRT